MRLSANDLRGISFSRVFRGFDEEEVNVFLAGLAEQLEKFEQERLSSQEDITRLEAELERYRSIDQGLRDTLLEVRNSSTEQREISRKEAELIIREAEFKAGQIIQEGYDKRRRISEEINSLKEQKRGFISRLNQLISGQQELLDLLSREDLNIADVSNDQSENADS
jgi:cell division initiation protein